MRILYFFYTVPVHCLLSTKLKLGLYVNKYRSSCDLSAAGVGVDCLPNGLDVCDVKAARTAQHLYIRLKNVSANCTSLSSSQQNPTHTETDARDLLQLALDRICELQRKLMQRDACATGSPVEELTGKMSRRTSNSV